LGQKHRFGVGRALPVYPDKQTFSESFGMSQKCHDRTSSAGATVIPEDQTGSAICWRFHRLAFESQSNRQETKQPSAASHKHGLCEH